MQTIAQRERTRRKAVRRASRVKAVGCVGLFLLFVAMAAIVVHGGVTLLIQTAVTLLAFRLAWWLLRRLMRGSPRDTSPSKARTRQIDPRLAMEFRADEWQGPDS